MAKVTPLQAMVAGAVFLGAGIYFLSTPLIGIVILVGVILLGSGMIMFAKQTKLI